MPQLLIKYRSQDYAELELDSQEEYLIGRSQDCDIPLEGDHSLSRKHSKLYFENGNWVVKKISQSGQLFYNNQEVDEQVLENQDLFNIGQFSFIFQEEVIEPEVLEKENENKNHEANIEENKNQALTPLPKNADLADNLNVPEIEPKELTSEYTAIIQTNLTAQLTIYKPGQSLPESVKLTENSWVIGRDKDCNSSINYKKLSRHHFEITKEVNAYWLTDLGSSNGTKLNGDKLKKNESQELKHDDNIEVKNLKVIFEIINENFKNFQLAPMGSEIPLSAEDLNKGLLSILPKSKKKRFLYIGLGLVIIMSFIFSGDDKKSTQTPNTSTSKLKPEQVQLLEDHLLLAQTHYTSAKYQLCSAALKKIHASIKAYKNSRELDQYCRQAYQLRQEQEDRRQKVEEKEQRNNKIVSIVEKCKQGFISETLSTSEINSCLYPAIEINPNHPDIANLKALINSKKEQQLKASVLKENNSQSYKAGLSKYNKALRLYKKNQLRAAIKAFQRFLNSSHYGIQTLKAKARTKLQQTKNKFNNIIRSSLSRCMKAITSKQYKKGVIFCKKVLKQDPDNTKAESSLELMFKNSKKELREIYKDSVFEESVGSVELAKKMWKEMLKKGIPGEEYYEKANRKLQKYEDF